MALSRLRRQDLHKNLCVAVLVIAHTAIYINFENNAVYRVLYIALGIAAILTAAMADVYLGKSRELIARYLLASFMVLAFMTVVTVNRIDPVKIFIITNITYMMWAVMAKKWLQHELCPGWTMLVYDSRENLEKAEAIAADRKDLVNDAYHCAYQGRISELDNYVKIFKTGQMIVCLDTGTEEVLGYCRREGIIALVEDKHKDNRLLYFRPDRESPKHYAWSSK